MAIPVLLFGIIVGLALGLTGGGGSVFAVPLLVFGLGMDTHQAVTLSLTAVTAVALVGAIQGAKKRLVEFRAGSIFAVAGLITAPLGVYIADQWQERTLLLGFSLLVIAVAVVMWIKAGKADEHVVRAQILDFDPQVPGAVCKFDPASPNLRLSAPCSLVLVATGTVTGLLSGLFGVGGGFVIVPALMLVTQLAIHRAVATSLYVICLIGGSGVISGIFSAREIPGLLTAVFITGGVAGLFFGQQVAKRLEGPVLQKVFAVAILLLGVVTIAAKF